VTCFSSGSNVPSFLQYASGILNVASEWIDKLFCLHRLRGLPIDSAGLSLKKSRMNTASPEGINFEKRPDEIKNYANKRAETFDHVRSDFSNNPTSFCAIEI
jgi:hypothetical protein